MQSLSPAIEGLERILKDGSLREALIYLNTHSRYRYTSIYRFDDNLLHSLFFYDRERPETLTQENIPIADSYCVIIQRTLENFATSNAPKDPRTEGHPNQEVMRSYVGVPLKNRNGDLFGTICHFDHAPKSENEDQEEELLFLESAAALIEKRLGLR
jgi:GAF domain-containing protein